MEPLPAQNALLSLTIFNCDITWSLIRLTQQLLCRIEQFESMVMRAKKVMIQQTLRKLFKNMNNNIMSK